MKNLPLGSCSPVCTLCVWCSVCGVLGRLAPVHRCACLGVLHRVHGVLGLLAPVHRCVRCVCVLCMRRPWPLVSCSPVCVLAVWCCVCGVLGRLTPVHRCACLGVLCRVHGVLGLLAPVHRCVRCVCVLCMRRPWPLVSCSPVCVLAVLCCLCRVLGHVVPVFWRACFVCGLVCVVSWAFWLVPSGVLVWCVLCGVSGVLGHLVRALRCVRSVCCGVLRCVWCSVCAVACVMFWASQPRFTGAHTRCVVLCALGVLGLLAPVHRCVCVVCCVVCAASWATWLLFTGVRVWYVVWCARCPGPRGSCSPVCMLSVRCFVPGVLGLLAPVHRCAFVVCFLVCAVSWATWLLFTGVRARCAVFCVWCPGPLSSCSPVCLCGVLSGVQGALGLVTPVHRCARSVCGVLCVVSPASWLLFTDVLLWSFVGCVRCPGPLGSCSPLCALCARCFVFGVLGILAPVHRCACVVLCVWCSGPLGSRSAVCPRGVCCVACAVSWVS